MGQFKGQFFGIIKNHNTIMADEYIVRSLNENTWKKIR